MRIPLEKPYTPEELVHFGVKGMKWGVRKEREPTVSSSKNKVDKNKNTKEYMAAAAKKKKLTAKEAAASLAENQAKHAQKFGPSDASDSKKGLTPKQKKILIGVGVGVAAIGTAGIGYYLQTHGGLPEINKYKNLAGKSISPDLYKQMAYGSKMETWAGKGYFQDGSFTRPGFELPIGHTFHRISSEAESTFSKTGTYTSHSIDDFNRYLVDFADPSFMKKIEFQATKPVKVPDLTEVLDTMRRVGGGYKDAQGEILSPKASKEELLRAYSHITATNWDSPLATQLLNELKTQGYSAIVDEQDAGVIGETPLFLFNSDNVGPKNAHPITTAMVDVAIKGLKELEHRKYWE